MTLPWDHALSSEDNHRAAAEELVKRLEWGNVLSELVGGGMPNGKGWAFLVIDR